MEADIRLAQAELNVVGMMVENKRGTQILNPMISVIHTPERLFSATTQNLKRPLS